MDAATAQNTILNLRARAKKASAGGKEDRAKELEAEAASYEAALKKAAKPK